MEKEKEASGAKIGIKVSNQKKASLQEQPGGIGGKKFIYHKYIMSQGILHFDNPGGHFKVCASKLRYLITAWNGQSFNNTRLTPVLFQRFNSISQLIKILKCAGLDNSLHATVFGQCP